ncbi:Stp1/IreP family PP2C-type Ser/Thr phosphatase [Alloalcanivorax gelatiniphagus]
MYLHYSAISDVGRVRRENQDSGYAGPWLLTVCDGVGGAVRGDLASSTAVQALRKLDQRPDEDILGQLAGGVHRADDRIAELVEEDPDLNGTSTTATIALFDGTRFGVGHIGDSRAYLYRRGELRQLTHDHTFVQSLIDEGRITEEQSRTHPHRNLILKALDGIRHEEPDLFEFPAEPGDRLFICSDGACGTLTDARMADILSTGTPDFAAVELVRASLEAGSTDNVTCIVADVSEEAPPEDLEPLLVGAAADLPRRMPLGGAVGGAVGGLFRGHRSGDTGEIPPVPADVPEGAFPADPLDVEAARYAPRDPGRYTFLRRLMATAVLVGLAWMVLAAGWSWSQQQFYVADQDGKVAIFRGLNADLPGISLSHAYEITDVDLEQLSEIDADAVRDGIEADDLDEARLTVDLYAARQDVDAG